MKVRKKSAAKKQKPAKPRPCFYGHATDPGWAARNAVATADQGVPEPAPYAGSGWDYGPNLDRAGGVGDRVPNGGGAT